MTQEVQKKVAILGGGIGGLTAAYYLTRTPALRARFHVTVYEAKWAPGGKIASGRSVDPATQGRIEEHGLHLFFGAYHNAGRLLNDCFDELDREGWNEDLVFRDWASAFEKHEDVYFMEKVGTRWQRWDMDWASPASASIPGRDMDRVQTAWEMLVRLLGDLCNKTSKLRTFLPAQRRLKDLHTRCACVHAEDVQAREEFTDAVLAFARLWQTLGLRRLLGLLTCVSQDIRQLVALVDVLVAALKGIMTEGLMEAPGAFDKANDRDLREFLRQHGCVYDNCAPVRGFYSGLFAYPVEGSRDAEGRPEGALAAGVGLRAMLRAFTDYHGEVVWRMRGGMGEVVVLPLYRLLQRRGVKFEFLHQLKELAVSGAEGMGDNSVTSFKLSVLADGQPGRSYDPLITVDTPKGKMPAWPSEPLYEQLVRPAGLAELRPHLNGQWPTAPVAEVTIPVSGSSAADEACDEVVLAIPPAALRKVKHNLAEIPAWRGFLEGETRTLSVPTMGVQCWFNHNLDDLGWNSLSRGLLSTLRGVFAQEPGEQPIIGAFARPMDVWADMTHLSQVEPHVAGSPVQHIAYLTGVRDQHAQQLQTVGDPVHLATAQREEEERVRRREFQPWLETQACHIWPNLVSAEGQVKWDWFVADQAVTGPARLAAQYFSLSLAPSDEYVLSVQGTTRARLRASESGCRNLALAGDWVRNGLDLGTLEGAVMGGMQAANCILQRRGMDSEVVRVLHEDL